MNETALLIDFGSTYTKLRAVNLETGVILGSAQGPSTVSTNVNEGLNAALSVLEQKLGSLPNFKYRLASSSAAGGLAMITVGLVKELTAEAARLAALGAGAKLIGSYAKKLTDDDTTAICRAEPDILLLAGGTDGGNEETIWWNANKLAEAHIQCPVVIAGNRRAGDEIAERLISAGVDARVTENVMPEFNVLNVEPARSTIREVFIERIVQAKGIDDAAGHLDQVLMPTPAAVMEGAHLISEGTTRTEGRGPLVVIDIGGATTDVHSIADGAPSDESIIQHGLSEPFAKRTVEGDLGMRHNARTVVNLVGIDVFATKFGMSPKIVENALSSLETDIERLPVSDHEFAFDAALAETAVLRAMTRHAGRIEIKQSVSGPVATQFGKDLSNVGTVIGTGGVLAKGGAPATVLATALADGGSKQSLQPKKPAFFIDAEYALFACGLLSSVEPEAALRLAKNTLRPVT